MKPKSQNLLRHSKFIPLTLCVSAVCLTQSASGAALTWDGAPDGGGASANANWSTGTNWVLDAAPAATGDTLTFAGTTNLTTNNDLVTALATSGTAITFASGAGAFTVGGGTMTMGLGSGAQTIISQQSTNAQVISSNINLIGGGFDRSIVFASGAGSLTLSGNINFANDWLFPTNAQPGTIVLSGTNSGDGKGGAVAGAGNTNTMRAMMRTNAGNTQLVLGSDTALGNSGSGSASAGTANFKGVLANQTLFVSTTGGDRNLSGSSLAINNAWIDFNGANNLTIGNIITVSGNRDLKLTNSGSMTVSNGIFLSHDQTSRQLYLNMTGAGELVVNGSIHNTFHSGGITALGVNDVYGQTTFGNLQKAGAGKLTLNGDSSATFAGEIRILGGKVVLGHPNALGAASSVFTAVRTGDTVLDSTSVTLTSSTGIVVGMTVTGDGIPEGTTVVSIASAPTIELSQAASATATGVNLSFSITKSSSTVVGSSPNFGTLDLNGQTIAEPISKIEGGGAGGTTGALINTNTSTAAAITTDLTGVYNFSIDGAGDISVPRLIASGDRVITKNGNGTFTTNGSNHNSLCGWVLNTGTLVFANTSGLAADRGMTINGGTLRLSGLNSNLINDGQIFSMTGGTFDLNGKGEAVASIGGTGGTITNSSASASTLYVGGGNGGSSTASFAGIIQDGTGVLNLNKEGTGTQTLTGTLAYSGSTTVTNGTLELQSASLNNSAAVDIKTTPGTGVLYLNFTGTDIIGDFKVNGVSQGSGTFDAVSHPGLITGTGKLQVGAPAGYSGWVSANGATGQTADQDHDNDGVSNGVEYFIGGPTGNTTGFTALPGVTTVGPTRSVTWTHAAGYTGTYNTDFFVETSTTLASGSWTTETLGGNVIISANNVTYTFPPGPVKNFVRLRVKAN